MVPLEPVLLLLLLGPGSVPVEAAVPEEVVLEEVVPEEVVDLEDSEGPDSALVPRVGSDFEWRPSTVASVAAAAASAARSRPSGHAIAE